MVRPYQCNRLPLGFPAKYGVRIRPAGTRFENGRIGRGGIVVTSKTYAYEMASGPRGVRSVAAEPNKEEVGQIDITPETTSRLTVAAFEPELLSDSGGHNGWNDSSKVPNPTSGCSNIHLNDLCPGGWQHARRNDTIRSLERPDTAEAT